MLQNDHANKKSAAKKKSISDVLLICLRLLAIYTMNRKTFQNVFVMSSTKPTDSDKFYTYCPELILRTEIQTFSTSHE